MKKILLLLVVALLATTLLAPESFAGLKKATHKGFYISFGFGPGTTGFNFDSTNITVDRETGVAGNLRLGWALTQNILLGYEGNFWAKEFEKNVNLTLSNSSAAITWYPSQYIFLKGGPALANATVSKKNGQLKASLESKTVAGIQVGAGAELRIMNRFSLMPTVQWYFQKIEDAKVDVFSFTMGVGWHW